MSIVYKQNPTKEEWESIKTRFTALYQVERKSLEDVRRMLEDEYNFTATEAGLKTKTRAWNLQRNYSASDKDQLLPYLEAGSHEQRPDGVFQLHGNEVDWKNVQRHQTARKRQHRLHQVSLVQNQFNKFTTTIPHTQSVIDVFSKTSLPIIQSAQCHQQSPSSSSTTTTTAPIPVTISTSSSSASSASSALPVTSSSSSSSSTSHVVTSSSTLATTSSSSSTSISSATSSSVTPKSNLAEGRPEWNLAQLIIPVFLNLAID